MIVFLHIPRTGGTTLYYVLKRQYGDAYGIVPTTNQRMLGTWPPEMGDMHAYQCVSGHVDTRMIDDIRAHGVDVTLITILRDPVDRMLSLYEWYRVQPQRYQAVVSRMTFAEFVRHPDTTWICLDNQATRQLASHRAERHVTEGDLVRAMQTLDACPVIGLTERYDESLERWAALFGWRDTSYERQRVQAGRLRRDQIDPALVAEVYEHQHYDMTLYTHAVARDWGSAGIG